MVALLALGLHGVAVAGVITWQAALRPTRSTNENAPEVTFFSSAPVVTPTPTPEPAAPKPAAPAPKVKRLEVVAPREIPAAVPEPSPQPEVVPEEPVTTNGPETTEPGDTSTGGSDSTGTGSGDGPAQASDGTGTGGSGEAVLPFGEGMTRPECDRSLAPIEYTREALEAKVEGLLIIRCTIRVDGTVQSCQPVKGLPFMTEVALAQVSKWRCAPATFQGRPVNIDYFFNIRLTMPR
ncbi:MAG: energy transducer TonB [Archangium sp.]|nr:energy transducer TonB [Archangium sp.]